MNNMIFIWLACIFCFACNSKIEKNGESEVNLLIANTKWECEIGEGCINIYEFKIDSSFTFFSCEMENEYFGKYYFKGKTLMIDQLGSINDENLHEDSSLKSERILYSARIEKDKLVHTALSQLVGGNWVESDFNFDEKLFYKKQGARRSHQ